jgi:hypothetical protein
VNWQAALESLSNAAASRLWPSADLEMGFSVSECSFSYHSRSLPLLVPPLSCRTSVELDARSAAHIGGREGRVLPQLVVGRGLRRRLGKVRKKINSSAGLENLSLHPAKLRNLSLRPADLWNTAASHCRDRIRALPTPPMARLHLPRADNCRTTTDVLRHSFLHSARQLPYMSLPIRKRVSNIYRIRFQ